MKVSIYECLLFNYIGKEFEVELENEKYIKFDGKWFNKETLDYIKTEDNKQIDSKVEKERMNIFFQQNSLLFNKISRLNTSKYDYLVILIGKEELLISKKSNKYYEISYKGDKKFIYRREVKFYFYKNFYYENIFLKGEL